MIETEGTLPAALFPESLPVLQKHGSMTWHQAVLEAVVLANSATSAVVA